MDTNNIDMTVPKKFNRGMPLAQLRAKVAHGRGTNSSLYFTLPWQSPLI